MDNSEDKDQTMGEAENTLGPHHAIEGTAPVGVTESTIPTPAESTESSSPATAADQSTSADVASPSPSFQGDAIQHSQSAPSKPPAPALAQPLKRRPRRTGQPLHILLQDCGKQASGNIGAISDISRQTFTEHILGYLCKKSPDEIKAIVSDKKALAADLRNYSNEFVLTSARDRVISEVDDQGKELLKDVDPERDVIKQRFEDESSVFKSYDDAIHDIRVDLYFEGIKPRKQESEEDADEVAARNLELNTVLDIWDQFHKRVEVEPKRGGRATQSPFPSRGGRPSGPPGTRPHPYAPYRSPVPGPGPGPALGPTPPHYGPPFAGPPPVSGPPFRDPRAHHRGYHERSPYREEYYPDRREDYRRPDYDRRDPRDHLTGMRPPGPGPMGRPDVRDMRDMRDPREFRDRPGSRGDGPFGAGGGRYDDRRRDRPDISNAPPPRDNRHSGPNSATSSPLVAHPSLPPRPQNGHYDGASASHGPHQAANPMYPQQYPPGAHQQPPQMDLQAAQAAYGAYGQPQGYPAPGQVDYSGYSYSGYGQDAQHAYAYPSAAAAGWDMSGASAASAAAQFGAGLQLLPFSSDQPGRHKAVPLPTDFMSGPSDAPRLSMPEPHEILGTIRGVIIRDAQGNIGLCQYHFTQAS
ncbi:hypothetical protein BGX21_003675 [Mortierella sp. AD011]|nr:hypothetical protein BGX20_005721 [Mortierella sp. AD010]KAF9400726.1 hypothetical protein BGX21_003675 [Mortierella sp. AD011]